MPKIYGSDSQYLKYQKRRYSFAEKLFLYGTTLLGTFSLLAFLHGIFVGNSTFLRWLFTALFCLTVFLLSKAWWNRERADKYSQGQEGEQEVLAELRKLPENFAVFCDLKLNKKNYNIDFLVTGPTGLFAIEVKSHKVNVYPKYPPEDFVKQSARNAIALQNYIRQHSDQKLYINAVLVYSSDKANVPTFRTSNYVTVIHKAGINKLITTSRPISKELNIQQLEHHFALITNL